MARLLAVIHILGRPFMSIASVLNIVYLFVCGKHVTTPGESNVLMAKTCDDAQQTLFVQFSAFVDNLQFLYPGIFDGFGPDSFKHFDNFSVAQGFPCGAVFVTERECCRFCGKHLTVCEDRKDVVVYHLTRGTYLGSRFTKKCLKCKVQEHYGFYAKGGKRVFDSDCLEKAFLLSTEETAIDMKLMQYLDEEVVQGACPFLLKAKVYNSVHGYPNVTDIKRADLEETGVKAKKRRYSPCVHCFNMMV